jgi:hypothetical protein
MLNRGLLESPSSEYSLAYYIDFRHPHHFELISAAAAVWVTAHILIQIAAYFRLRRAGRDEAGGAGKLATISLGRYVQMDQNQCSSRGNLSDAARGKRVQLIRKHRKPISRLFIAMTDISW